MTVSSHFVILLVLGVSFTSSFKIMDINPFSEEIWKSISTCPWDSLNSSLISLVMQNILNLI